MKSAKLVSRRKVRNAAFKAMLEHLREVCTLVTTKSGLRTSTREAITKDIGVVYQGIEGLIR